MARRLAWPGSLSVGLLVFVACGGSGADDSGFEASSGAGGSLGFAGSGTTTGGHSTASSGSGGSGGGQAGGVASTDGGAAGKAGKGDPKEPKGGSGGVGGAGGVGGRSVGGAGGGVTAGGGGMAGSGGVTATCPATAPADKAVCTSDLKCEYPDASCDCNGKEGERTWHCKEPMTACPAKQPKDGGACTLQAVEPCHYEMSAMDCTCTASRWVCVAAPIN